MPSNTLTLPSPLPPPSLSSSSQERKRRRNDSTMSSPTSPSVSSHLESPVTNSSERPLKRSKHSNSTHSPRVGATTGSGPSQQHPVDQGMNRSAVTSRSPDGESNGGRTHTADHLNEHDQGAETAPGSAPLSPTTTLANSTPYIDATNWTVGGSMSPSTKMLTPFMSATSSSSTKEKQLMGGSTNSGGGGGGNDSGDLRNGNARPRLPSIAAMLNSPKTISSPSLFASSNADGTVAVSPISPPPDLSPDYSNSGFSLRNDGSQSFVGADRSSSGSSVSAPFQLPSSSLPITSRSGSVPDGSHSINSRSKQIHQHRQDYEGDDEETTAAAALLMQFSSERDRDSGGGNSHSRKNNAGEGSDVGVLGVADEGVSVAAYTPGSILGFGQRHH